MVAPDERPAMAGAARGDVDLASVAALIGDPARARMLLALCGGEELPAAALAAVAGLSAPATSAHLGKMLAGGLVTVTRRGRHRDYRLASRAVVSALEALARLAPDGAVRSLHDDRRARALHFARVCYDHVAGRLGVRLADALVTHGVIVATDPDPLGDVTWRVGPAGDVFTALGVPAHLVRDDAPLYACLDWSVGRPHLSGAVGSSMMSAMIDHGWLRRARDHRALRLTDAGRAAISEVLDVRLDDAGPSATS